MKKRATVSASRLCLFFSSRRTLPPTSPARSHLLSYENRTSFKDLPLYVPPHVAVIAWIYAPALSVWADGLRGLDLNIPALILRDSVVAEWRSPC